MREKVVIYGYMGKDWKQLIDIYKDMNENYVGLTFDMPPISNLPYYSDDKKIKLTIEELPPSEPESE